MSPNNVPVEVHTDGARFSITCTAPLCPTKLSLELDMIGVEMLEAFLDSRVAIHIRSIALELGWDEHDHCPFHATGAVKAIKTPK